MGLKHATWGDFSAARPDELDDVIGGHSDVRR
jgi:hypothetical protein